MGFVLNPAHMKFLENNLVQMLWRRPFSKGLKDKMDHRTRQIRGGHSSKRHAGAIRHTLAARCLLSVLRLGALQADLPPHDPSRVSRLPRSLDTVPREFGSTMSVVFKAAFLEPRLPCCLMVQG
jgi:hypothetical protein